MLALVTCFHNIFSRSLKQCMVFPLSYVIGCYYPYDQVQSDRRRYRVVMGSRSQKYDDRPHGQSHKEICLRYHKAFRRTLFPFNHAIVGCCRNDVGKIGCKICIERALFGQKFVQRLKQQSGYMCFSGLQDLLCIGEDFNI